MAFSDSDPLEDDMGVRCQDMTPNQLLTYVVSYQRAFGLNIKVDGLPEHSVFKAMQRIYGQHDAGLIVKWVFYKHRGRHGQDEVVTPISFAKGRRWWVDKMYFEMQDAIRKETSAYTSLGGRGLADL